MGARRHEARIGTIEERVAYLEGRTDDHAVQMTELRETLRETREEMHRRFDEVARQAAELRAEMHGRFENVDGRSESLSREMHGGFDGARRDLAEMRMETNSRFEHLDSRTSWAIGLHAATLIAVLSAFVTMAAR